MSWYKLIEPLDYSELTSIPQLSNYYTAMPLSSTTSSRYLAPWSSYVFSGRFTSFTVNSSIYGYYPYWGYELYNGSYHITQKASGAINNNTRFIRTTTEITNSKIKKLQSTILNGTFIIKYNVANILNSTDYSEKCSQYFDRDKLNFNNYKVTNVCVSQTATPSSLSFVQHYTTDSDKYYLMYYVNTYGDPKTITTFVNLSDCANSELVFTNAEVHEDFLKFLLAIADPQDQIALTFGDNIVLANKPVTEISVVKKTLNLVDVTIDGVTSEVEIHPQEDKVFLGFSLQENSTVATIPIGTTKITLNENTVFYEVWGTYKPEPNFFTANFYKNSAESHRVDKTEYLTSVFSAGISLREETNIIYPTILLQYDKVPDFNYCYIEYFGRYYYVTDITSIRNNIWQINLSVDVLMSFKDTIKSQMGNVIRQENIGNSLMVDTNIPVLGQPRILINSMGSPIFSGEYNTPLSDGNEVCFVLLTQGKRIEV